jgi:CubicO group peptidase (beta-lactamase class C family)
MSSSASYSYLLLDSTLADFSIDERTPLTAAERSATIRPVRFGQLYLQEGQWAGRQILPADWVTESTGPHTDDGDGTGYGYMWWTYRAGSLFTAKYPTLGKYTFCRADAAVDPGLLR